MNPNKNLYETIVKECYWDYHIGAEDIERIVLYGDRREQQNLFNKILNNAANKMKAIQIFSTSKLRLMFDALGAQTQAVLVLRNVLLEEQHTIERLMWKKH